MKAGDRLSVESPAEMTDSQGQRNGLTEQRLAALEARCRAWRLTPDGEPFASLAGVLMPVSFQGQPAMLKIAQGEEERRGAHLMVWWGGDGAARVLAHDGDALLLDRAMGDRSLAAFAQGGRDDEASHILVAAAARLHAPRTASPPSTLVPLARWFAALEPAAEREGGIFRASASMARSLLAAPRDIVALHGDIHHRNVLDFGPRSWLAIDPKGLIGERGYDFANIFCNPDLEIAAAPGRLARQATRIAAAAGLERRRLVQWVLAYAGLSAAWSLEDGDDPTVALTVAQLAASELR